MPANLTPQYQKAEDEYRKAQSPLEQVDCLQRMLQLIPKHKGTEKLQADLKTRLKEAKAEREAEKQSAKKAPGYRFSRQGAGQVVVLGAANAGKSRLLAELTNAEPDVAVYPFTTREPSPGMMVWEDIRVQLIDTPPVSATHIEPYLINIVRSSDLVLLCFDGSADDAPEETAEVVSQFEVRKTILCDETGYDPDDYSIVRLKTLLVVTRADDSESETRVEFFRELQSNSLETVHVEFDRRESVESLPALISAALNVIRVYTKVPGKKAIYADPFTIPVGGTVGDLAFKVHRELADSLKFAKVWHDNAASPINAGRDFVLTDKDLVELHV